jgi:hypothetical protein
MEPMSKLKVIHFEDGTSFVPPRNWHPGVEKQIIGVDSEGLMVARSNLSADREDTGNYMDFTLSPCCGASFKGCDGYIGCRHCYADISDLGGGLPFGPITYIVGFDGERDE